MQNILLYVSSGLIICSYIVYFLMLMIGRIKVVSRSDGFDVTKDIISEYDSINVIESNGCFTIYNIRRKVIKLATRCYYGKDLSSISLSLIEAGISVIDNQKNMFIDLLGRIFSNLKFLYIFPVAALLINNLSFNVSDAKVGIAFMVLFSFLAYVVVDIKSQASVWINDNLSKIKDIINDNFFKIISFINGIILLDKFIFLGEFVMIIRFVLILLGIN